MEMPQISAPPLAYFDPGDGRRLAYRHRPAKAGGPTVLFLPGYASDMEAAKAEAIDAFCAVRGMGCLRFDYSGTGSSGGEFADGTLNRWLEEVVAAIDLLTEGSLIVAGSSMGGWLALHAALRPERPGQGTAGNCRRSRFYRLGLLPGRQGRAHPRRQAGAAQSLWA